jgi:hypothetical protein
MSARATDALLFPKDDYTVQTMLVPTSAGERQVTYRLYAHVPYVAKPVGAEYQSLDLMVPVEVDGVPVDATDAPIILANSIGGYMSVNNLRGDLRGPRGEGTVGERHAQLALAKGWVAVWPGCRGRDNQAADGTYYGKAPAAIVDLKAAVRYLRHNRGIVPGNVERIFSTGCSAGGALSALLGASGDSPLYQEYLEAIGAADESDSIFAASCYSPILDLEHGDMAYEWMSGQTPNNQSSKQVDQELSAELKALFAEYQASLGLLGTEGFGVLTADNYADYLMRHYLIPSATRYLGALSHERRSEYLAEHDWIRWDGERADFTFADYALHAGRFKLLPAFDDLDLKLAEPSLFGNVTTEARHFTEFSLRKATGDPQAELDGEIRRLVDMMNPQYFVGQRNSGCARHWWLRRGTGESGISMTAITNLAVGLENSGCQVDTWFFWDAAHCIDMDAEGFIAWVARTVYAGS